MQSQLRVGTHFVDQAGVKLKDLPASVCQVLGLKVFTTTPDLRVIYEGNDEEESNYI